MKKITFFFAFLLYGFLLPAMSQNIKLEKSEIWRYKLEHQYNFDIFYNNSQSFTELKGELIIENTANSAIREVLDIKFPPNNNTRWSDIVKISDGQYSFLAKIDPNSNDVFPGANRDWVYLGQIFIRFYNELTTGSLILKLNVNNNSGQAYANEPLVIEFGEPPPPPQKDTVYFKLRAPEITWGDSEAILELLMKNPTEKVAGWQFDVKLPAGINLEEIWVERDEWQWNCQTIEKNLYRLIAYALDPDDWSFPTNQNFQKVMNIKLIFNWRELNKDEAYSLWWANWTTSDEQGKIIKDVVFSPKDNLFFVIKHPRIKGDVDGDSDVDLDDVILAIQHILEIRTLTGLDFWAADMDDSSIILVNDIIQIINIARLKGYTLLAVPPGDNIVFIYGSKSIIIKGENIRSALTLNDIDAIDKIKYSPNNEYLIIYFKDSYYGVLSLNQEAKVDSGYQIANRAPTAVETISGEPLSADLKIRPNPITCCGTLEYQTPCNAQVKIIVYNELGQPVETVIDSYQEAGWYEICFWPPNYLVSGNYFCRMTIDGLPTNNILFFYAK